MRTELATGGGAASRRGRLWLTVWIVAAVAYAAPLGWHAYENLVHVNHTARARLIEQHRLWEVENFRGRPESWTRFASRLLTDQQLLRRVAVKYGGQSEEIEREYRRDLAIARAEVIVIALSWWLGPVAALYGVGWFLRRRTPPSSPPKIQPASAYDPRYQPPS